MKEKSVLFQNTSIYYRVYGAGKPVMLLHGFAEDGDIWRKQAAELEQHFQVIVPDLPGSGRSPQLAENSMENYADAVNTIMNIENDGRTGEQHWTLIGHSMGGYIALAFAEKYAATLDGLGLIHSTAFADSPEKIAGRQKGIEFIRSNGVYPFLKTSIQGLFSENFAAQHQERIDVLVQKGNNFTPVSLVSYYEAMIARHDRTKVLQDFAAPVLFVAGEHDNVIPPASSLAQCYLPNESHVYFLDRSAHMSMMEEPEKLNAALVSFLKRCLERH